PNPATRMPSSHKRPRAGLQETTGRDRADSRSSSWTRHSGYTLSWFSRSWFPDRGGDSKVIASENREHGLARIAVADHDVRQSWDALGRHETESGSIALLRRIQIRSGCEEDIQLRGVINIVEPQADVVGSHQLDHVIDVLEQPGGEVPLCGTEKRSQSVYPDDASGGGTGSDQLVRDVARMRMQRVRVGVGEDDRPARPLHHLRRGSPARVRAARHHADPGHLGEYLSSERRQPAVLVLTPAPDTVVTVVSHQHPAHAEPVEDLDHAELIPERTRALQIETNAEPSAAPGFMDIRHCVNQQQLLGVPPHETTEMRQHPDVVRELSQIEPYVQAHHGLALCAAALQLRQKGVIGAQG